MNSLSWFLYLADVMGNLSLMFTPLAVIALLASVPLAIAGIFVAAGNYSWVTDKDRDWYEEKRKMCAKAARILAPIGLISLIVVSLIPSKNTMYAIAASEVGERIIQNQSIQGITNDATKALHQWIRRQIDPETKPGN